MSQCENKVVWDLEICKNVQLLREADHVILYGAAQKGREIFGWLLEAGIEVDCFCDMDLKKWGSVIQNVHVISPFEIQNLEGLEGKIAYVIACIQYPKELCRLLDYMELNHVRVITYWGIKTALQIHAGVLYGKDSWRWSFLQIESRMRKNHFIHFGLEKVGDLISAPDDAVWMIQPGKTASSSLNARFRQADIPFLSEHYLEYPDHIVGGACRKAWEEKVRKKKSSKANQLKVIIAVREPLSRDYSAFWQAFTENVQHIMWMPILTNDFQKMYAAFTGYILRGSAYTKEELGDSMPYTWNDEFEWFDEQIKRHLGVDVFQYPFDRERGYVVIKQENVELFLFKVEKMEALLSEIAAFLGSKELPVVNANVAEQKWYGLAYQQFRKEIKLPASYVRHYYEGNSKMDYFYTQEEKMQFLEKWRGNIEDDFK